MNGLPGSLIWMQPMCLLPGWLYALMQKHECAKVCLHRVLDIRERVPDSAYTDVTETFAALEEVLMHHRVVTCAKRSARSRWGQWGKTLAVDRQFFVGTFSRKSPA